jgi:hypothetical protein
MVTSIGYALAIILYLLHQNVACEATPN